MPIAVVVHEVVADIPLTHRDLVQMKLVRHVDSYFVASRLHHKVPRRTAVLYTLHTNFVRILVFVPCRV